MTQAFDLHVHKIYDSVGRRKRDAPPTPSGDLKDPKKIHLDLAEIVHLYGGYITVDLLHRLAVIAGLTKQKSSSYVSMRVCEMKNNLGLLRPAEEIDCLKDRYQHPSLLKITDKCTRLLQETGRYSEFAPSPHGWFKHQMMTATLYQMFQISAHNSGIAFIPQHQLKLREPHIWVNRLKAIKVIPDMVFMLEYSDHSALIFLEIDRGTEKGVKTGHKTWGKSIKYYQQIFKKELYKQILDAPKDHHAYLVTVTTSSLMHRKILKTIARYYKNGSAFLLTHSTRAFGPLPTDFYPPRFIDMLDVIFDRHEYPPIKLNRKS